MDNTGGVRVFDGTTDFRVWRARVENELMRYHLLGYVMVRGYDGSQSFMFNGEEVPPRTPAILVDDEQQLAVKEESLGGRSVAAQQGKLSRWDVLGESAEAKSILQRFLHPDVEAAILNKNIYDSWEMLCALYGNRSNPGAHDVFAMHRVLHHIRLGDKKGETTREFITRWDMLLQQYALATGIQLTDAFRSVSFTQTLPSAWRPTVASWRGVRPFVPFAELVEKVLATRHTETAIASNPAEERAAEVPKTNDKTAINVPPPIDVTPAENTIDLTRGEASSSETRPASTRSRDSTKSRYEKKFDDRFESNGPLSCFYCLKVGHHMKRCWYLKADIEKGTTHNAHHKFSCTVTLDRNEFMVNCLEAYIEEVNQERARYGAPGQRTTASRAYGDYAVADSVGRKYNPQQPQEIAPRLPKSPSPSHSFQQQSSSTTDYRKRSHSVFQPTEDHISSRDPRLNRSRSVYRSTEVAEEFSPRKRARAPSFERQLQSYY
eukprot:jgi/Phyca11/555353/estExt2_Genewise1Plus.C_PHYCAscaffold_720072